MILDVHKSHDAVCDADIAVVFKQRPTRFRTDAFRVMTHGIPTAGRMPSVLRRSQCNFKCHASSVEGLLISNTLSHYLNCEKFCRGFDPVLPIQAWPW